LELQCERFKLSKDNPKKDRYVGLFDEYLKKLGFTGWDPKPDTFEEGIKTFLVPYFNLFSRLEWLR